jgi:hypothetical protein
MIRAGTNIVNVEYDKFRRRVLGIVAKNEDDQVQILTT